MARGGVTAAAMEQCGLRYQKHALFSLTTALLTYATAAALPMYPNLLTYATAAALPMYPNLLTSVIDDAFLIYPNNFRAYALTICYDYIAHNYVEIIHSSYKSTYLTC